MTTVRPLIILLDDIMSSRIIGILIQIAAVLYILMLLYDISVMFGISTGIISQNGRDINLDLGMVFMPFALWYLGDKVRDGELFAQQVAVWGFSVLFAASVLFITVICQDLKLGEIPAKAWLAGLIIEGFLLSLLLSSIQNFRRSKHIQQAV